MYKERIERLLVKLNRLKRVDRRYAISGSDNHRYALRETWTAEDVRRFEQKWKIKLPEEYEAFLLLAGSGGAGPYYGLERPEDDVYTDLDYKDELNLVSGVFPSTGAWNDSCLHEDEREAFEKDYFNAVKSAGLLRISNFGCGVSINLVVNGPSYGEIWVDDRTNDGGIYPDQSSGNNDRLTFLAWYEAWLDRSLDEMNL